MKGQSNMNISEIEKAIGEKEKELEQLKKDSQSMDPAEKVKADVKIDNLNALIRTMKESQRIMERRNQKPAETAVMSCGLNKYIEEKQERDKTAEEAVSECSCTIAELQRNLDQAMKEGNIAVLDELTENLENEKRKLPYLQEALANVRSIPAIPEGAVTEEWLSICESYTDEWNFRMENIKAFADAYRQECHELMALSEKLKNIRARLQKTAERYGNTENICRPVFTKELTSESVLLLSREDRYMLVWNLFGGENI